ncbi:unnamed protein product [Acanthocheilonema viteae]|uniref:Uncharacterized protein n=1 Tax=Acanthocheilonema viteae TaxID=6277 RepID=A0A498SM68_ACAVI|nr:unnamed protein product [Acanthocheilonema viteae]
MQTAFQTLTIADGVLAIRHVRESPPGTPRTAVSPLRDLNRGTSAVRKSLVLELIHRSEEDLNDFIFDENFLEDSWGLHTSVVTSNLLYLEKSASNNSDLPELTSEQLSPVNSSIVLPVDPKIYRMCWVPESDLDSMSTDENYSLNHLSPAMDSTYEGYSVHSYFGGDDISNCSGLDESSDLDQSDATLNGYFYSKRALKY